MGFDVRCECDWTSKRESTKLDVMVNVEVRMCEWTRREEVQAGNVNKYPAPRQLLSRRRVTQVNVDGRVGSNDW